MCSRPALALSSMSFDLAVDEFKAVSRIGNLFAKFGGKLGEQVAVFEGGGFGVGVQHGDLAREQCVPLRIESGNVALGVPDLARNAQQLDSSALARDGGIDLVVIVQETLQRLHIPAV